MNNYNSLHNVREKSSFKVRNLFNIFRIDTLVVLIPIKFNEEFSLIMETLNLQGIADFEWSKSLLVPFTICRSIRSLSLMGAHSHSDGANLARLMITHGVGVYEDRRPISLKKVNESYFEKDEQYRKHKGSS